MPNCYNTDVGTICNQIYVTDGIAMNTKNWNFLLYVHSALLLWLVLFVVSIFIPDGGKTTGMLAIGNALFLFSTIPLAIFSFILKAKGRFSTAYERPIVVLSIFNLIVGILAWCFVVMLMQMP